MDEQEVRDMLAEILIENLSAAFMSVVDRMGDQKAEDRLLALQSETAIKIRQIIRYTKEST